TGASPLSGDDVGDARIDDQLDLVLQAKLAPLQARNLQLVARWLGAEGADSVVELTVLGLERIERRSRLVVIHCHDFTATRFPPEPPKHSDDLRAVAARRWKASRQM